MYLLQAFTMAFCAALLFLVVPSIDDSPIVAIYYNALFKSELQHVYVIYTTLFTAAVLFPIKPKISAQTRHYRYCFLFSGSKYVAYFQKLADYPAFD